MLTGGVETLTRATVYTDAGFLRDLPPLNHERHNHGCGHYVNQDLDTVSTHRNTMTRHAALAPGAAGGRGHRGLHLPGLHRGHGGGQQLGGARLG